MTQFSLGHLSRFESLAGKPGQMAFRILGASLIVSGLTAALTLWLLPIG
jgi:hypothetical protein